MSEHTDGSEIVEDRPEKLSFVGRFRKKFKESEDFRFFTTVIPGTIALIGGAIALAIKAEAVAREKHAESHRLYEERLQDWSLGRGSNIIIRATPDEVLVYNRHVRRKKLAPPPEPPSFAETLRVAVEEFSRIQDGDYRPRDRKPRLPIEVEIIEERIEEALVNLEAEGIPYEETSGYLVRLRHEEEV